MFQLVGGYRSCPILACELADAMFDGQRMMTARQLYFTLATAFASHSYGHRSTWQLEAKPEESESASSGVPVGGAAMLDCRHADGQDVTARRPVPVVEGSSGGLDVPPESQATALSKTSAHPVQQAVVESQLPVDGRMRLSGIMRSTG